MVMAILKSVIRKELGQRNIHRRGDLRKSIERGNCMPILYARKVTAKKPSTFLNVSLRHPLLQAVRTNRLTDVHMDLLTGLSFIVWVLGVPE